MSFVVHPVKIRADRGTENGLVAAMQRALSDDENAFVFGASTHNQVWFSPLNNTLCICVYAFCKNLLWEHMALSPAMWHVDSCGPLPSLFKRTVWGQKGELSRDCMFSLEIYS